MKIELIKVLAVGAGGFVGASGRYILSLFAQSHFPQTLYPVGTTLVNLSGCLLIGMLGGFFELKSWMNPEVRLLLFVGVLGGFTTFSTFAHESFLLWKQGELLLSLLNVCLQVFLGILLVWFGYTITKIF